MGENEIAVVQKKKSKRNVLYAQVTEDLYKRVYKAAIDTGFSMADVIRLCVERSLPEVDRQLMKARYGNEKK